MKKLMIFGMFIGMMIARPTNAFFGRKEIQNDGNKEVELPEKNAKILLNRIQHELHRVGFENYEFGNEETAAIVVTQNFLARDQIFFLFIRVLSKELLMTIPKAVSFVVSSSKIEDIINQATDIKEARKILNNWLESNQIKVKVGKLDKEGNLTYIIICRPLGQEQGEITAVFDSKKVRKVSTEPGPWATILTPYTESGKLRRFKLTIKGTGEIKRSWKGEETYNWEKTIEGPKVEFLIEESGTSETDVELPVLPLPTWKEIPLEDGLATALVVDRSGSMTGEKINRARQAAYVYVDTSLEQKDMFSLAAFSSDAESISEPISISEGREMLKKDILSLSAGGSTNVGSGLTIAFSHLSSCNLKEKRALLMSDGQHNTGTYQPEVAEFQKMGWPIDTVAFGKDADQEMLAQIAYQTGGSFYPAETSDISSIYHKLNVLAHQGSVYRSYNDFIRTGQKLTYDIPVEPDMKKIGFFTNWQGSRMETILFSPNKTVINRSNINQQGRYIEGQTHNCFELDSPQVGPWQALITGYDLPPKGEQINFHSFCQSDVSSNFLGFQPNYSQNQEVRIGVKLAEKINGRLSPLRGAQVIAEIKKPSLSLNKLFDIRQKRLEPVALLGIFQEISGSSPKITLFDDGSHQDVRPGDGIYAASYSDTTINGPYLVTIDCQGSTSQGLPLKRTLQESFQVGPIEQNSFTISDFLALLTQGQGAIGSQLPQIIPKRKEGQPTEQIIETLLNQFLKR